MTQSVALGIERPMEGREPNYLPGNELQEDNHEQCRPFSGTGYHTKTHC